MFPEQSGYAYAGNDPIGSLDMNGNFKIVAGFEAAYPEFTRVLKEVVPKIVNNPFVLAKLVQFTGLSRAQVARDMQYGQGATIEGKDTDYQGHYDYANLELNHDNLKKFEAYAKAAKSNPAMYGEATMAYQFFLVLTTLHEYVHFGQRISGHWEPSQADEQGKLWESTTFGNTIGFPEKSEAIKSGKYSAKQSAQGYISNRGTEDNIFIGFLNGATSGNSSSGSKKAGVTLGDKVKKFHEDQEKRKKK